MEVTFYLALLLLASFTRGNNIVSLREDDRMSDAKDDTDENIAFESFGSPVYGVNSIANPGGLNGKSAYNPPVPPVAPNYAAYLASLGLSSPFSYGSYSRYGGLLPYAYPSLPGYGSPLLNNPAYTSSLLSGLGYSGYGSPYFGRSVYPGLGYGYLPFSSNFGYRYGGPGYLPAGLRAPLGPLAPVSAPGPGISSSLVRAPVAPLPPPAPTVPNTLTAPVPAAVPYTAPYRGKDGSVRYGYAPGNVQDLPVY